jgi:hypothetical protein
MSSGSSVNETLEGYIAGRVPAGRVVAVVAAAYYGEGGRRKGDGLQALMEIIERAHPGIIELSATPQRPGFGVRLAERPFPKRYEGELRQAVQAVLVGGGHVDPRPTAAVPRPSLFTRFIRAIRKVFSA